MELFNKLIQVNGGNSRPNSNELKAVKAGNYYLSIQGSDGHYCSPRELLPVGAYFDMELAILNSKKAFLRVSMSSVIRSFPRYDELIERRDGPSSKSDVFGYVNVGLLNDLYLYLNTLSNG